MKGNFSGVVANAEELQQMANYLEEFEKTLCNHYDRVQEFLEMLVEMGWQDDINKLFTNSATNLSEVLIPLQQAIRDFSKIKHQEAGLEMKIRELKVPTFNI